MHPERVPAGSTLCQSRHLLPNGARPATPRGPPELLYPFWSPGPPALVPPLPPETRWDGARSLLPRRSPHPRQGRAAGLTASGPRFGVETDPKFLVVPLPTRPESPPGEAHLEFGEREDAPGLVPEPGSRVAGPARVPASRSSGTLRSRVPGRRALEEARAQGLSLSAPCSHRGRDCRSESKLPPRTLHFLTAKWKVERHIYIPARELPVRSTSPLRKTEFPFLGKLLGMGVWSSSRLSLFTRKLPGSLLVRSSQVRP